MSEDFKPTQPEPEKLPFEAESPRGGGPDRRKRPTPFLSRYTFFGRRRENRRLDDPQKNYYVDRLGGRYWWVVAIILVMSVADALFTLNIHKTGRFMEVNPLLNAVIFDSRLFQLVKYLLTVLGILALCLHKFFTGVRELIIFLIVGYTLLNVYQIWLQLTN